MRRHRTPWQPSDGATAALAFFLLVIIFIGGWGFVSYLLDSLFGGK